MKAKKGDMVKVHYTGTLEDGTMFDSSEGKDPMEFELGAGNVIKGFDSGITGMAKDEEKEITIKPEDAYGEPREELIKKVPKDQLPQDKEPQAGMMLMVSLPNGQQMPAKITDVTEKEVTIDLNHPLVGKTLKFKVKVVAISEGGADSGEEKPKASADDLKKELEGK